MKRCDRPATHYSWFNGFRMCPHHEQAYRETTPADANCMVSGNGDHLGPCDVPSESLPEFWERFRPPHSPPKDITWTKDRR